MLETEERIKLLEIAFEIYKIEAKNHYVNSDTLFNIADRLGYWAENSYEARGINKQNLGDTSNNELSKTMHAGVYYSVDENNKLKPQKY